MIALDDHRQAFERAGFYTITLEDDSFRTRCPACSERLTVHRTGGTIVYDCSSGCEQSVIVDRLAPPEDTIWEAPASWHPVPLLLHLAGEIAAERPTMLKRADGVALLYPGRLHSVSAEPESGKGWLALTACREAMNGHQVAYVDYEDTEASIAGRLRALDVDFEAVRDRFHYYRPDEPISDTAVRALLAHNPALVVIDGVTEALAIEGLDMANNQDVAEFYKRLARPFARAGAAVLLVDHVTKDREARGRYAIGAQHKLAGVDVAYKLDIAQPFGRGREGLVKVTVTKDRPGFVREYAADRERIALMRLTSADGLVTVALEPPDEGVFRPTHLMERVSRELEDEPGMTTSEIRQLKGKTEALEQARKVLISEGWITAKRDGTATRHYPLKPFREDMSPVVPGLFPNNLSPCSPPLRGEQGHRPTGSADVVPRDNGHHEPTLEDLARLDELARRHPEAA